MRGKATPGRRAGRNAAGKERTRALVLGVLAVVALVSLKISSGATGAGLLWNRSPGHPPAGVGGPWSPLVMLGWASALIFWGAVLVGAVLLVRWAREATTTRSEANETVRSVGIGLLVLFVGVAGWLVWGRLALTAGPPEAVVREFLRAASAGDWGRAESYMTSHARYRIGQEGLNGMEQFATTRLLHPFTQFSIVRVESDGDKATVLVRLASPPGNPGVGAHIVAGRMEGGMFVHAHRFILQREGRAWRIYEFEDAGVQP